MKHCEKKTIVIDSREGTNYRRRRHECTVCGERFTTIEVPSTSKSVSAYSFKLKTIPVIEKIQKLLDNLKKQANAEPSKQIKTNTKQKNSQYDTKISKVKTLIDILFKPASVEEQRTICHDVLSSIENDSIKI